IISDNEQVKDHTEIDKKNKKLQNINIPKDVIEDILAKLHLFEQNNDFIKNGITLNSISKELETNSSYLSKIINFYKEVSFSNYLNNLRITYAIDKLKKDSIFRNYSIHAIALEVGFNTL